MCARVCACVQAVYFGNAKGGLNHGGAGKGVSASNLQSRMPRTRRSHSPGPWIMADMENALWGADRVESNEEPIQHTFVTAMVKGDVSSKSACVPCRWCSPLLSRSNPIAPPALVRTSRAWTTADPTCLRAATTVGTLLSSPLLVPRAFAALIGWERARSPQR